MLRTRVLLDVNWERNVPPCFLFPHAVKNSADPVIHLSIPLFALGEILFHQRYLIISPLAGVNRGGRGASSSRKTQYFRFTTFLANICDPLRCSRRGKWVYKSVCLPLLFKNKKNSRSPCLLSELNRDKNISFFFFFFYYRNRIEIF